MSALDLGDKILKVRPDVFIVRAEDGVWLRNNHGSFFVRGSGSYRFVRFLLSHLEGTRDVEEICGELPAEQRVALEERLLKPLLEKGFIRELQQPIEEIPDWLGDRYAHHLAFLEQYVDRPLERLLEIRSRRVVALGHGQLLRALIVALAELGLGRVHVATHDEDEETARSRHVVEEVSRNEDDAEWTFQATPSASLSSLWGVTDEMFDGPPDAVILAVSEETPEHLATTVEELRNRSECHVAVLAPVGGLLVGSLLDKGECWECIYRSVMSTPPIDPAPPSASLAAFQLGHSLFCRFAGPEVPQERTFVTVDCRTLETSRHSPRRHPGCLRHEAPQPAHIELVTGEVDTTPIRPDVPSSGDGEAVVDVQDRIVEHLALWTDPLTGPLLTVGEEELSQLPLSASRCRLQAPGSLPPAQESSVFECRAVSAREARNQVVLFALEWLAARTAELWWNAEPSTHYGVGYSRGEAIFRAIAGAAGHSPALEDQATRKMDPANVVHSPAGSFLIETLADMHPGPLELQSATLPDGLLVVQTIVGGEKLGSGIGIDTEHATHHALATAISNLLPSQTADFVSTAHSAPPADRWGRVIERLGSEGRLQGGELHEATCLLPFANEGLHAVVLVRTGGES